MLCQQLSVSPLSPLFSPKSDLSRPGFGGGKREPPPALQPSRNRQKLQAQANELFPGPYIGTSSFFARLRRVSINRLHRHDSPACLAVLHPRLSICPLPTDTPKLAYTSAYILKANLDERKKTAMNSLPR